MKSQASFTSHEMTIDAPSGIGAVDRREAALGIPAVVVRRAGRAEEERAESVRRQALVALGLGVVAGDVEAEGRLDVLGDQPVESAAGGEGLAIGDVAAGEQVRAVALVLERGQRELAAELPGNEGAGEAGAEVEVRLRAGRERDRRRRVVGERLADVLDRAADGVLAVERPLGSAQHLDPARRRRRRGARPAAARGRRRRYRARRPDRRPRAGRPGRCRG